MLIISQRMRKSYVPERIGAPAFLRGERVGSLTSLLSHLGLLGLAFPEVRRVMQSVGKGETLLLEHEGTLSAESSSASSSAVSTASFPAFCGAPRGAWVVAPVFAPFLVHGYSQTLGIRGDIDEKIDAIQT
jgi:hypothetical protein